MPHSIVLGSRSPRRQELLSLLVPSERILILPPVIPMNRGSKDCVTSPQSLTSSDRLPG